MNHLHSQSTRRLCLVVCMCHASIGRMYVVVSLYYHPLDAAGTVPCALKIISMSFRQKKYSFPVAKPRNAVIALVEGD